MSGRCVPVRPGASCLRHDHVGLNVADLATAEAWYATAFGLEREFATRIDAVDLDIVMLRNPELGHRVELLSRPGSGPGLRAADPAEAALTEGFGHLAFDVAGLDEVHALQAAGTRSPRGDGPAALSRAGSIDVVPGRPGGQPDRAAGTRVNRGTGVRQGSGAQHLEPAARVAVVTGGAGAIGSSIVSALGRRSHRPVPGPGRRPARRPVGRAPGPRGRGTRPGQHGPVRRPGPRGGRVRPGRPGRGGPGHLAAGPGRERGVRVAAGPGVRARHGGPRVRPDHLRGVRHHLVAAARGHAPLRDQQGRAGRAGQDAGRGARRRRDRGHLRRARADRHPGGPARACRPPRSTRCGPGRRCRAPWSPGTWPPRCASWPPTARPRSPARRCAWTAVSCCGERLR